MKKKSGSKIGRLIERIFNFRTWADWDRMKSYTLYLWVAAKTFFVPQAKEPEESFEAAQARLQLTDADLLVRKKGLFKLFLLMLGLAALLFVYAVYHLIYANFLAFILSLVVMCIALTLALRYHFWYFQIKSHKLGCTLQEWFKEGLMGDKS